jgi:glucose-6-phosphate isomerase
MCAVSTNLSETSKFGIVDERVIPFWDWVGGRFSVCSAIGMLPLSLHFGFAYMLSFLRGANDID